MFDMPSSRFVSSRLGKVFMHDEATPGRLEISTIKREKMYDESEIIFLGKVATDDETGFATKIRDTLRDANKTSEQEESEKTYKKNKGAL